MILRMWFWGNDDDEHGRNKQVVFVDARLFFALNNGFLEKFSQDLGTAGRVVRGTVIANVFFQNSRVHRILIVRKLQSRVLPM